METILQDLRYSLRFLRQRPLFAAVAALSIAIGIGANTVIFGVVNSLLLRPLPGITDADAIVEVGRTTGGRGFDTFSYPELRQIREHAATALQYVAGWRMEPVSFSTGDEARQVMSISVSHEYFAVMGIRPDQGRFFLPEEDATPGAQPVLVVSHRFWQEHLGGAADVIGRSVTLNRHTFTIVGVAPAAFRGHMPAIAPEIYLPITMFGVARPGFDGFESVRGSWLMMLARLQTGITVQQADAAVKLAMARLYEPADPENQRSAAVSSYAPIPAAGRMPATVFLAILTGLVTIVLVVTCMNVAGMLLARAAAREREIAIRLALGCSRARLVRQLLAESVVLFGAGGVLGIMFASWLTRLLTRIELPTPIPVELDLGIDAYVLAFGLGIALLTGIVFGLAPAFQATRPNLTQSLKNEASRRDSRAGRLRRGFVMAQVGLSVVLLLAAGLFLRSLQRAASVETGFDAQGVRMVSFDLARDGYDDTRGAAFVNTLLRRTRELPGASGAALATELPLDLGRSESPAWLEESMEAFSTDFNVVSDGYFELLRVPLLRGRTFLSTDEASSVPVAIVSRAFAERAWPGEDPIGKRLRFDAQDAPLRTVVGLVADVKNSTLMETAEPMLYVPLAQNYQTGLTLLAGTSGAREAFDAALRTRLLETDPGLALAPVQSLAQYTALGVLPQRLAASITSVLAMLALLLCALGIYGVIAYTVAQQTREIGIRMALGARSGDVIRLVIRRTLLLAAPGLAFGLAAGLAASFALRGFLLGVAPVDPAAFMAAPLALLAAALLASWQPARRAAAVEPSRALRTD